MYPYPLQMAGSNLRQCFVSSIIAFLLATSALLIVGCGGSMTVHPGATAIGNPTSGNPASTVTGNTSVTVLATSTANDQLAEFHVEFTGIALTTKSGKTANLISTPVAAEFMHLNGGMEPLASASIPNDVYTSATLTLGSAWFTCTSYAPSTGLQNSTFEDGAVPSSNVTVTLPAPIDLNGTSMALSLNLLVSRSASFSSCAGGGNTTFTLTPTFAMTPISLAAQPADNTNGLVRGLHGLVSTINSSAGRFTVAGSDGPNLNGPSWQFNTDPKTVLQGISAFSQLSPGSPVDVDAAIQPDGSLLATRAEVTDTDTMDLNVFSGPVNSVVVSLQGLSLLGREQQGYLDKSTYYMGAYPVSFVSAVFQISSSLNNLSDLPFAANFNPATLIAGQNLSVTSHVSDWPGSSLPVSTVTLMPQTLNGTVTAISSAGAFTTYAITLAPYDLFPALAVQPGQSASLRNPGTVVVYADGNTQMLITDPVAVGAVFRFNGLVFNDHGTLRMDCAQVNDGVPE